MSQKVDVAVIGGGIIGSSIAYYLAKAGLSVHLLERGEIAQGTTRAAAGMLGAHSEYINDAFYSFARNSQTLYQEFLSDSGIDSGYTTGGILQLARSDKEQIALSRWNEATYLSTEQVHEKIPNLAPPAFGAYVFEEDVHIHPEKTGIAFYSAAKKMGVTVSEHSKVDEVGTLDGAYCIRSGTSEITAKHIVIAGGAASPELIPGLQMTTVKGECMQLDAQGMQLPYTLFHKGCYIVPRQDGTLLVGATMEESATHLNTTNKGITELNAIAEGFIPGLSRLPVLKRWAGLRPKTVDELPYIGLIPGKKNMYVAAGHFRNGILLAPATASMIRDMIIGKKVHKEWLEIFNPKRGIFNE